jgi:hypothetical protein
VRRGDVRRGRRGDVRRGRRGRDVSSVPRVRVSRTPAKHADIRDVKNKGYLPVLKPLPPSESLEMSGGHSGGHGEGHGAHPDCVGAVDTMAPFIPFSNTLGTLYCEKL